MLPKQKIQQNKKYQLNTYMYYFISIVKDSVYLWRHYVLKICFSTN